MSVVVVNGVLLSKRDPRAEKLRDFRGRGHCSCRMCKGYKRDVRREARRRERGRSAAFA